MVHAMMHDLRLEIKHSWRENIGGTIVGDGHVCYEERVAETFFEFLIHIADLETSPGTEILRSTREMRLRLSEWGIRDHHGFDPICRADASPVCNCRITARNIWA
jgi:hypothetical protein